MVTHSTRHPPPRKNPLMPSVMYTGRTTSFQMDRRRRNGGLGGAPPRRVASSPMHERGWGIRGGLRSFFPWSGGGGEGGSPQVARCPSHTRARVRILSNGMVSTDAMRAAAPPAKEVRRKKEKEDHGSAEETAVRGGMVGGSCASASRHGGHGSVPEEEYDAAIAPFSSSTDVP